MNEMALLDQLAEFIAHVSLKNIPSGTLADAKLHIFDSLGATLIGAADKEAEAHLHLMKKMNPAIVGQGVPVPGFGFSMPLSSAVFLTCVATRLTEMDDIDIASCTTVGSVVVPSAFLLTFFAQADASSFMEGVVVGYEVMTRFAAAVNGAEIIYRGIWPTYLAGALTVAAIGSKTMGLSEGQIKNSLAIALSLTTGIAGKIKGGLSSRWLTLGCALQNGLAAAFAAESGFAGDASLLDAAFPSVYGLDLKPDVLLKGLGKEFQIGRVNLKPYCTARQMVASIEAFRGLLGTHSIQPEKIEEIEVSVPEQYRQMIDKGGFPEDRLASITSVQYQLALAAFYEEDLYDSERNTLRDVDEVHALIKKVRVNASSSLTAIYPRKWAGKVSLTVEGKRYEQEVLSPKGDADQPMTWDDVDRKLKLATRRTVEPKRIDRLRELVTQLDATKRLDGLIAPLSPGRNL
jgi:2-methylcitrate dehydratase PrpD